MYVCVYVCMYVWMDGRLVTMRHVECLDWLVHTIQVGSMLR